MSGKPAYLATHTPQEAGVDAFLPKPFTFRDIEAAIGAVMSGGDPDYRENSRARMLAAVF
jgi:DNA-binding response OmpR family regulator